MAIEIPGLVTDRLAHPEWGTTPPLERFTLPASRILSALEGASESIALLDGLRAMAAAGKSVEVYLASDRGLAQVLMDGRRVPIGGAAREALLNVLGRSARAALEQNFDPYPGKYASATVRTDLSELARAATVNALVQESRQFGPGLALSASDPPTAGATTAIAGPLLRSADASEVAQSLARAIGSSGLFLEAHLAQWLRGERSLQQIQDEVHLLPVAIASGESVACEQRATTQIQALAQQTIFLAAQAWDGQPVRIEIECDRERHHGAANSGDSPGMFQATLRLDLPRIGSMGVCIRVMGNTVAVRIEARDTPAAADLTVLESALAGRGLQVAQLSAHGASAGAR